MELGPRDRLSQAFWHEERNGRTITAMERLMASSRSATDLKTPDTPSRDGGEKAFDRVQDSLRGKFLLF